MFNDYVMCISGDTPKTYTDKKRRKGKETMQYYFCFVSIIALAIMLARYFSVDFDTLLCYDLQTPN